MKNLLCLLLIGAGLLHSSCAHKQGNSAGKVKLIAVLPAEIQLTGKQPKKLKPDQIEKLEEAESLLIQNRMVEAIVSASAEEKHHTIGVVDADKINRTLQSSGISVRESWNAEPEKLAELLGVDAVLRIKVTKTRYMSNLSGYGINLGTEIVEILKNFYIPGARFVEDNPDNSPNKKKLSTTHSIDFYARLIRKENGTVVWSDTEVRDLDFNDSVDQAIAAIIKKAGEKFPKKVKRW